MAFSKRIRMITFRVSDAEYEALKTLYPTAGARSVSEFARSAIERLLSESDPHTNGNGNGHGNGVAAKVEDLDVRLRLLDREVARLARLLHTNHEAVND